MAHSYVDFVNQYLHLPDSDLVWLMRLVIAETQQSATCKTTNGVKQMIAWWEKPESIAGAGCIDLRLDDFISTKDDVLCFTEILSRVEAGLLSCGKVVPGKMLNDAVQSKVFLFGDQPTERLVNVIVQMKDLLQSRSVGV